MDCSSRRHFLCVAGLGVAGALLTTGAAAQAPASAGPVDPALIEDLVAANRILYDQGVVDGFGHVSTRHDKDANRYLLARSMAPALVTADDIMEFDLDSTPVDQPKNPDTCNVFALYKLFASEAEFVQMAKLYREPMYAAEDRGGKPFGYGHAKKMLLAKIFLTMRRTVAESSTISARLGTVMRT